MRISRLLPGMLLCVAVACEQGDRVGAPTEPDKFRPTFDHLGETYPPTANPVPCSRRYSAWSLGLHALGGGYMTALSPTNCSVLATGSPVTFNLRYKFGSMDMVQQHWVYFTKISTSGTVTNQVLVDGELRADNVEYPIQFTYTPTSSDERLIISVGHNPQLPGSPGEDREIVLHYWRQIPQPTLSATVNGGNVDLSWTQNHRYLVHLIERRPVGGTWHAIGIRYDGPATSHTYRDTPPPGTYEYRIGGVFDLSAYQEFGQNIEWNRPEAVWTRSPVRTVTVAGPPPEITTSSPLPSGAVGTSYSVQFSATGGTGSLTWSPAGGTLPPGVSLSSSGLLSGTPSSAGTYNFSVRVRDSASAEDVEPFTLTVNPGPLSASILGPNWIEEDDTCTWEAYVTGGVAPYTYQWYRREGTGKGGTLVSTSSTYTGSPTGTQGFTLTLNVTDAVGTPTSTFLFVRTDAPLDPGCF